jgi:hypothetical protein
VPLSSGTPDLQDPYLGHAFIIIVFIIVSTGVGTPGLALLGRHYHLSSLQLLLHYFYTRKMLSVPMASLLVVLLIAYHCFTHCLFFLLLFCRSLKSCFSSPVFENNHRFFSSSVPVFLAAY